MRPLQFMRKVRSSRGCFRAASWSLKSQKKKKIPNISAHWLQNIPSSQISKSVHLKWGQHNPPILQGAAAALPEPIAFHLTSTTRSAWKGTPPSARGRRGKDKLCAGYVGMENRGFLLFRARGVLSEPVQVGAALSSFPLAGSAQEQQWGSRGRPAELCARALRLMNWKY